MKRRDFVRRSTLATAGMAALPSRYYARVLGANDRIQIGVIGAKGMGWSNVNSLLNNTKVELVAICDVDDAVIESRLNDYKELRSNKVKTYKDYRKLLGNNDIDAVVIGTPDHWHCKMMVDAVAAGKHVYLEKPIANTIEECYIMKDAVTRYGKIVQVGQWQRSGPHYKQALDIVRSGVLGNIRLVKCWAYQGWMGNIPVKPDSAAPEGVDYKMWLGPAPLRSFNENRFHFNLCNCGLQLRRVMTKISF